MPTPRLPLRQDNPSGMSLVELLVALTIAILLSALTFNLFGITESATRAGLQRSAVVQQALSAETRLRNDFANMVGPNRTPGSPAGAIIVIPALRTGVITTPGGGSATVSLRSDQLVFFYDAQNGGLMPGTGSGQPMTSLTTVGVKASQAKVWIGHVQSTSKDETSALDWTMGRQATLLLDSAGNPFTNVGTPLSPSDPLSANFSSDIATFRLDKISDWMRGLTANSSAGDAAMVSAFAVTVPTPLNYTQLPTVVTQPLNDGTFDASDVLGAHRIFLRHVSEIAVQYTMDTNSTGLMDKTAAGAIQWYPKDSDVFGLGGSAAQTAALAPKVFYPQDDQPRVVHLGYYQGPDGPQYTVNKFGDKTPYAGFGDALAAGAVPTAPERANYVLKMTSYAAHHNGWRPGAASPPAQSAWPRMIRIRYRLHDRDGAVSSVNEELSQANRADFKGTRCSGLWFEHVFAVPYPRVN